MKSISLAAAAALALSGAALAQTAPADHGAHQAHGAATTQAEARAPASPADVEKAKAALVSLIGQLQAGTPDYTKMAPHLAEAIKAQQPALTPALAPYGKVESASHVGSADGLEKFEVKFEKATATWSIALNTEGQISGLGVQ